MSYSKPFHNTLNYASTANIEEVMKFYNLGDKTFETDFSKTEEFSQFDVINDKINDCIEILVIIAHVSLDIH